MTTKTNQNETVADGLRVKTTLKAGTRAHGPGTGAGLRVKSGILAGPTAVEYGFAGHPMG
jgi:hypothetical protein